MDTLMHADIFFFVTTIVVVILGLAVLIALIYLILAFRRIGDIARQVRDEAILVREDIRDLRSNVRHEGFTIKHAFDFVQKLISKKKSKNKKSN